MRAGAERHELFVGDSVLAPVGVSHDISNVGTESLRVLVVWGPPGEVDFSAYGSVAAAKARHPGTGLV
jgi:mannose-6-phosphate isomerase-like protein (cupin superfamily)